MSEGPALFLTSPSLFPLDISQQNLSLRKIQPFHVRGMDLSETIRSGYTTTTDMPQISRRMLSEARKFGDGIASQPESNPKNVAQGIFDAFETF